MAIQFLNNVTFEETAALSDTDKFVVLDSGVLKYRTGTQVRSDIGAGTSNFDGQYSSLTGAPTLATVATSGSYNDLSDKPTIPAAYTDADVDAHLNTSTASSGEVLSWNGTDYDWISSGGSGTVTSVAATAGSGISIAGSPITTSGTLTITNTDRGSSQNIFKNFAVSGQSTVVADSNNDTLTLVAGTNVSITTNATNDSITINATDTDTNNYVSSVSFNTTDGVLTLNRSGLSSLTVDLDGRYLTGNQTITLTGDVTGSGTTSISTSISSNVVGADELNVSGNGTSGQVLTSDGDGTFSWSTPTTGDITAVNAGTNLTGGGTSGSVTLNMATGGVGAGTYGSTSDSTKIDTITVDAYGRVTAVATGATGSGSMSSFTISDGTNTDTISNGNTMQFDGENGLTATVSPTPLTDYVRFSLDNTGPGAGTYGSTSDGTKIDTITLDAQGRVTAVATGSTGDITGVTAGTGLSGGGTGGTVTLNLDLGELGVGGTLVGTDYLIAENGGVDNRQLISDIPLGIFNNDQGWTSNTGDITGVTAGTNLNGGATSGNATLNLDSAIELTSVQYGSGVTLSESSDRADLLYINSSTSSWGGLQIGNTSNEFIFSLMGDGSTGGIYDDQNSDWLIQWTENSEVRLYHNAVERLNTSSSGVTITGDLTVTGGDIVLNGTGRIQGIDTVSAGTDAANKTYVDNAIAGVPQGTVTGSGTTNYVSKWTSSTAQGNSIIYDNGTNVGIGTTSPNENLHIFDTTPTLKIQSDNLYPAAYIDFTNSSDVLHSRIFAYGNPGGEGLDLSYEGYGTAANSSEIQLKNGFMYFSTAGSIRAAINSSGNVGINDTTPSYRLDVNGTIRATGDVIAYSDIRTKENIKTIDNALNKVKALRGVEYNKIDSPEKSIGVIAQEIEEVIPQVVREDDQGMKSVAYGNITAVLIEAIKEQQKQIDELKTIIDGSSK